MRYVTRGQWGAREPDYRVPLPHPVREVYIHHGGGGSRNDDPFVVVPSWQAQHMDIKGWSDIAYQEIISGADEYDGWVFEGRGFGIQSGATGSPQDSWSLSICFIGNYEHDVPSPASLESAAQRLAYCVKNGRLTPDFKLYGDKDVNATACPGRNLYVKLSSIRRRVDEIVAAREPTPTNPPEGFTVAEIERLEKLLRCDAFRSGGSQWARTPDLRNVFPADGPTYGELKRAGRLNPEVELTDAERKRNWETFGGPRGWTGK